MRYKKGQEVIILRKSHEFKHKIFKIEFVHDSGLAYAIKIPDDKHLHHFVDKDLLPSNKFFKKLYKIGESNE